MRTELAQSTGVIPMLGTAVSVASGLLVVLLAVVSWWVRRQSREAKDARVLRETNLAALRWHYRVSSLAAARGWDTDPAWPSTPREMTAEFLTGQAEQDPASPIAQLAEAANELRKP